MSRTETRPDRSLRRARTVLENVGRYGFAARATVYLLLGIVSVLVAVGTPASSRTEDSDTGALALVARHVGGRLVLLVLFVGMAAYALWLLGQSFFGAVAEGGRAWPRVEKGFGGALYAVLATGALRFARGGHASQSKTATSYSAWAMQSTLGRLAVGLVGAGIVVAGCSMLREGVTRGFEKYFRMSDIPDPLRPLVSGLGAVGTVTRGIVFGLVGAFVIVAAVEHDPHKSSGLDYALRSLARTSAGPWLLVFVAAGLIVFGLFGYTEAAWRRTRPPAESPADRRV